MIKDDKLAKEITNPRIKEIRDFMSFYLDSTKEDGTPDFEKMINNAAYNMGEAAAQINALILQEASKLERLTTAYNVRRREVLEDLKTSHIGWTTNAKETEIMVDGGWDSPNDFKDGERVRLNIADLKQKMNKQALYVDFLKQCRDNIANYSMRVGTLVKAAQYCKDHGIMVTNV
jgi:hypothetical protein